jgi:hypothetical protein
MEMFVVIRPHREGFIVSGWEVAGVFNDRDLALAACQTHDYLICPVEVNRPLGPGEIFTRSAEYSMGRRGGHIGPPPK